MGFTGLEINRLMIDAVSHGWPEASNATVSNLGKDVGVVFQGEQAGTKFRIVFSIHDCGPDTGMEVPGMPGVIFLMLGGGEKKEHKPNTKYSRVHIKLDLQVQEFGTFSFERKYDNLEAMLKNIKGDIAKFFGCGNLVQQLPAIMDDYFGASVNAGSN